MKNNKLMQKWWLPLVAAFFITGCGVQSYVEKDPSADLNRYKTYAWFGDAESKKSKKTYKDFQESYLIAQASRHLEKSGMVKAKNPARADVLVDYDIMIENQVRAQSDPVYSRPFVRYFYNPYTRRIGTMYVPSRYMGRNSYDVPYRSGTVTINMVDNASKKLVWQGWAETEVTRKRIDKDDMNKIVKSIFRKMDLARR